MSYEPNILIDIKSLEKHEELFQKISYGGSIRGGETRKQVLKYLTKLFYHGGSCDVFGKKCIYCQPELTSFNSNVRKILFELDIEYCTLD